MSIPVLNEIRGVSTNVSAFLGAGVVTVKAEGSDGSTASVPVNILGAETPPEPAPPPLAGLAPSLLGGTAAVGSVITIWGAGFIADEAVFLNVISGVGSGGEPLRKGLAASGKANSNGVIEIDVVMTLLGPGAYTMEAFGEIGSYATAVLIVVEEK